MGVVCSIDHVAQTAEEKRRLRASGGSVVEMEAGGVAERAAALGVRFYCVKAVTDLAGEDMANDFNRALRPDGHFAIIEILQGALRHPLVRLPELIRLRKRCVRGARALGDFIAACRF
jgi:nucleoside phosphorylase